MRNTPKFSTPSLIVVPQIGSSRLGYISVAEAGSQVPFEIRRVYWTYYTPNDVQRGGHAHRELEQLIFAVAGTITFNVIDRFGDQQTIVLDKPEVGLYIPPLTWRDIRFSHNAVLLCLASEVYTVDDYIRTIDEFRVLISG
ncbi:MAG TPA: dTDP-6-deoxy-3,4-keto-hexulose isomerase [Bacteroidetes bacterium]|nr:dTDP-6-deoxy-3,4-keto-hexulose isomerase [Bacteroidota bacterium]